MHVQKAAFLELSILPLGLSQGVPPTKLKCYSQASLHAPPPPSLERRCVHVCRPGWSETGRSDRSPLISADVVLCRVHASRRLPPARLPLDPKWLGHQTQKSSRPSSLAGGGSSPEAASSNVPRAPRQRPRIWMPYVVGHEKCPASPFGPHAEHVEDLGLDDAFRDIRSQHLQCSGRGGQEDGHLGPRYAIREACVQKRSPPSSHCQEPRGEIILDACGACAMIVPPKSPQARQT